jgi:MinD-like ATPase involved in chromosome partitioning or flagellar assembly
MSLYSPNEASALALERPRRDQVAGTTWQQLALVAADPEAHVIEAEPAETKAPKTVVFYSFKGGVGRTTALTHVGWILATRGRKVVLVDMDFEAPGLGSALGLKPQGQGFLDYLYERLYVPEGEQPTIAVADILSEAKIPNAPGRLFAVQAGCLNLEYVSKLDDVMPSALKDAPRLWNSFVEELVAHVQPDLILVDSRTGINDWGAFALLTAATDAVLFMYPNVQNVEGVRLLKRLLTAKRRPDLHYVFSPLPSAEDIGRDLVTTQWGAFCRDDPDFAPREADDAADEQPLEPFVVPYLPAVAVALQYPITALASYYAPLANALDEATAEQQAAKLLVDPQRRWTIVEGLTFPEVDAANPKHDLRNVFQRTADFDRFLDETTCLIRGRKGTGKSALYWLLAKHEAAARELARGRLETVRCISGHGRLRSRPTRDEFSRVDTAVGRGELSWEAAWRAYLILRLHGEGYGRQSLRLKKFAALVRALQGVPAGTDAWTNEHTAAVLRIASSNDTQLLSKDLLVDVDRKLHSKGQALWLLYDDLDEDLLDEGGTRNRALAGLFRLLQDADARRIGSLRFKVFLREDIWDRLIFDNRSHFNGRDILLQWTQVDFLRLGLRQAKQAKDMRELMDRFEPIGNPDTADEDQLARALQILWGARREKRADSQPVYRWVYDRLTDASNTTFPRSLNVLLASAKDEELSFRGKPQPPLDHLLRVKALNVGLTSASKKRCQEIREEYPHLSAFFDYLQKVQALASKQELEGAWQSTATGVYPSFEEFSKGLQGIGLGKWREKRTKDQVLSEFRFADIYIHGFEMKRPRLKY